MFSFPTCEQPSSTNENINPVNNLATNIKIVSTPRLPKIIQLPLVTDEFIGKIGIAYIGSLPSFEIILPSQSRGTEIVSLNLTDKNGNVFDNIPFDIMSIPSSSGKYILTLAIPEKCSPGLASIALNLSNESILNGLIEIINYNDKFILDPPLIKRIETSSVGRKFTLILRGNSLYTRELLARKSNINAFLKNGGVTNTEVTIYPSGILDEIEGIVVRKRNDLIQIKFTLNKSIEERVNAELILATPRGIVSAPFIIDPVR